MATPTSTRRASGRSRPSFRDSRAKDGEPWISFGVMGGDMQPQGQTQIILNRVDYGLDVQAAADSPRWHHEGSSQSMGEDRARPGADAELLRLEAGSSARRRARRSKRSGLADGRKRRRLRPLRVHRAAQAGHRIASMRRAARCAATRWRWRTECYSAETKMSARASGQRLANCLVGSLLLLPVMHVDLLRRIDLPGALSFSFRFAICGLLPSGAMKSSSYWLSRRRSMSAKYGCEADRISVSLPVAVAARRFSHFASRFWPVVGTVVRAIEATRIAPVDGVDDQLRANCIVDRGLHVGILRIVAAICSNPRRQ